MAECVPLWVGVNYKKLDGFFVCIQKYEIAVMITKSDIFYSYLADTLQEVQLPLISTSGYYN